MIVAQGLALRLRLASHRSSAWRKGDAALLQRLGSLAPVLGVRRNVVLLTSERTVVPFTFGVWRPVIVLPKDFATRFTPEQQDAVLAHELAHVHGFDSAWRGFSHLTCALLWWHPLVWLAKRELDHASELVADESSLLLANGPDRLAECLLACAKELRRPALANWQSMDGGGFRSALGKRVTRLLQLSQPARLSRPVPWYVGLLMPLVCAALLWLGMAAVMKTSAPRGGAWRASILGNAFAAAAAENETPAPAKSEAAPNAGTNIAATRPIAVSPKRQAVYAKLSSIRLSEWGQIESLPLGEVIRGLTDDIRRIDPEHKGLSLILSGNAAPKSGRADAAGLPVAQTNEPVDVNAIVIRLGTAIKNPTLEEVMNIADRKIKYSVEDWGVLISPADDEPSPLHTRFFHMDSDTLQRMLQSLPRELTNAPSENPAGRGGRGSGTNGIRFLTEVTPAETGIHTMQNWFKSAGVDLRVPGKALFFNDRLGLLMVRATLEDLYVIERALQPFGIKRSSGADPRFFMPIEETKDLAQADEAKRLHVARLVQDGKLYYETGQLEAARTNLQAALRLQTDNSAALYYLDLVAAREQVTRQNLANSPARPPTGEGGSRTNQVANSTRDDQGAGKPRRHGPPQRARSDDHEWTAGADQSGGHPIHRHRFGLQRYYHQHGSTQERQLHECDHRG